MIRNLFYHPLHRKYELEKLLLNEFSQYLGVNKSSLHSKMALNWPLALLVVSIFCFIESTPNGKRFQFQVEEPLPDYQNLLLTHVSQIFCKIRATFINVSVEKHVPLKFSDQIITTLSSCSASGIMISG